METEGNSHSSAVDSLFLISYIGKFCWKVPSMSTEQDLYFVQIPVFPLFRPSETTRTRCTSTQNATYHAKNSFLLTKKGCKKGFVLKTPSRAALGDPHSGAAVNPALTEWSVLCPSDTSHRVARAWEVHSAAHRDVTLLGLP